MQEIKHTVALSTYTTFQIGGEARYFVDVRTEAEIEEALSHAKKNNIRPVILSGGSNVLVPDNGLDALVIHIVGDLYSVDGETVDSWAGTNLRKLIEACGKRGVGGWEKLAGIPGSIGGAVRGNAGAFGPEIKDFVLFVRALNSDTGESRSFSNAECDFSYRHSFFKDNPEWIITRTVLGLQSIEPGESEKIVAETIAEREKRHLQNVRAAGSYFMNPVATPEIVAMFESEKGVKSRENRVPAGWLIEKAGMKGATVGGAIASLQHPNYLVNDKKATSADVRELAEMIKTQVRNQFGVELKEEASIM